MAEAVGLSLAILGLAGNLKGCLDMFDLFSSARDLGRDYTILCSKFDIEKALLFKWAERVRLVHPDYDARLDDEATRAAVSKIIANIKHLLDDGAALQSRYGLQPVNSAQLQGGRQGLLGQGSAVATTEDAISNTMMQKFTHDFQALCIRMKSTQNATSTKRKVMWAIGKKEKFEKLVDDLAHFVSKLDQVVPDRGDLSDMEQFSDGRAQRVYRLMSESSRCAFQIPRLQQDNPGPESSSRSQHLTQSDQLRLLRDATREENESEPLSHLADTVIIQKLESIILEAVWFRGIQERRDLIERAHFKTLEWALESPQNPTEWDDLPKWLVSGKGVYWVSGKAGSGKSTLMKHIHNHDRSHALLAEWAGENSLFVGSFFFWGLGSPEQKTQRGLCRSLLYHIIERYPFLIPRLLPDMWRTVYRRIRVQYMSPLSPGELDGAFVALPSVLAEHSINLCLFIDGLDEYEGNLRDAVELILSLSKSPHIKLVVSSRPIPTCFSAFSKLPQLRLQDLNKQDIREYVDSKLGAHPYMEELREHDNAACTQLLGDLTDRANGVFLWIILACRSLLDGFDSHDRISELRAKLDELPRELEDMFLHMLRKVPKQYHDQTAKLLKLAYHCQVAPWHAQDPHKLYGMPALTLSILERVNFDTTKVRFVGMSKPRRKAACEEIDGRLRSRTGGLLELSFTDRRRRLHCFCWEEHTPTDCDCEESQQHDSTMDSVVVFMHRTVFEFLNAPDVWDTLNILQILPDDKFIDPDSVLLTMSFLRATFLIRCSESGGDAVLHTLFPFQEADESSFHPSTLKNFDRLFILFKSDFHVPEEQGVPYMHIPKSEFPRLLGFAAELGEIKFIENKLEEQNQSLADQKTRDCLPLLEHALHRPFLDRSGFGPVFQYQPSPKMVSYLLTHGYDPNQKAVVVEPPITGLKTIWELWVHKISLKKTLDEGRVRLGFDINIVRITVELVNFGADPEILIQHEVDLVQYFLDIIKYYEKNLKHEDSLYFDRLRGVLDEWHLRRAVDSGGGGKSVLPKRQDSEFDKRLDGPSPKRRRY